MSEPIKRRNKIRDAHRQSVKRTMTTVNDLLMVSICETTNVSELVDKLTQMKMSLTDKRAILKELDEEILEISDERDLNEEVEQADNFMSTLGITQIKLDHFLKDLERQRPLKDNVLSVSLAGSTVSSPIVVSPPVQNQADSESSTIPVITSQPIINPGSHRPHVKLPKLGLPNFNGDYSRWQAFWDTFDTSIHKNDALTEIDKFNYLNSLLEGAALSSVSGLSLSSENYQEAICILKRRFGNRQQIINRHMELLLNTPAITSIYNLKGIRHIYDAIEANVRSLKSLGIPISTYGSLLSSVIMNKLPSEMKVCISREMKNDDWDLEKILEILLYELEARERSQGNNTAPRHETQPHWVKPIPRKKFPSNPPTAAALYSSNSYTSNQGPTCTYCKGSHSSNSCQILSNIEARRDFLMKSKRCFVCLRKDHQSRNCTQNRVCPKCNRKHHISICPELHPYPHIAGQFKVTETRERPIQDQPSRSTTMYTNDEFSNVLLQTARANITNQLAPSNVINCRLILDGGSQRSYVTTRLRDALKLPTISQTSIQIKTFGSRNEVAQMVDVVQFLLHTLDRRKIPIVAFVVPLICLPLKKADINIKGHYDHLKGLTLADYPAPDSDGSIQILIGSDQYWELASGNVKRGEQGPIAIETCVGWVLSGPAVGDPIDTKHTLVTTLHISLDEQLKRFWDLESLGVKDSSLYEDFVDNISFKDGRYQVMLPWKQPHPLLPDNYRLCLKRLQNLHRRLIAEPEFLQNYDSVIQDQMDQGIVELIDPRNGEIGRIHYLPHHGVLQKDKATTKLRIVFDASAKVPPFPSLNDCLYAGPSFNQKIFSIILRFRSHRIALTGDIEKAFLMVSLPETDRDVLRFLWFDDIKKKTPDVIYLRFTRVVFGVSSSPFLLNGTIRHHIEAYAEEDPEFVRNFLRSIYVDDLTTGAETEEDAYRLYQSSKSRLLEGGFNLRKFKTNSIVLQEKLDQENLVHQTGEEETYAKLTLGNPSPLGSTHIQKILGIPWDYTSDELVYDLEDIAKISREVTPTKRNVVSVGSKFFDPLGFLAPFIIRFKMLFQELCLVKLDWDDPLGDELLQKWHQLVKSLSQMKCVRIPRYYKSSIEDTVIKTTLVGFCDASAKAYASVVYLKYQTISTTYVRFVASKTRVAPTSPTTIPRLELLSALILSRLISNIRTALEFEVNIKNVVCFTDSKVALYWIVNQTKEWKQFVQNRVNEIRSLTSVDAWYHVSGISNPADLPSRGLSLSDLVSSSLWKEGPSWLKENVRYDKPEEFEDVLNEYLPEMKAKDRNTFFTNTVTVTLTSLSNIISCLRYSTFTKLVRITALVLKFIRGLKGQRSDTGSLTPDEITKAEILWIKEIQEKMKSKPNFEAWKKQLSISPDENDILICKGRLHNAALPESARFPILLDKDHPLSPLIVKEAHERVMHSGVKATLTELRSRYWFIRGRQFVRKVIHQCVICKKFDGKPYQGIHSPPLPEFRVNETTPFTNIGVDFAGPLFIRTTCQDSTSQKTWICLFTCCITRAIHLELVPDLTTSAFLRCFQRFTSQRGVPRLIISDNGKTFVSAAKQLSRLFNDPDLINHLATNRIQWSFNLEKAPWWGGLFERLIQSVKRCLKRVLGSAKLTFEELSTVLCESESALNSRPLSFVSTEDVEEPLTPSHLLIGRRLLNLPDLCDSLTIDENDLSLTQDYVTRRMKHLNNLLNHFWKRWKSEYLLELRSSHRGKSETKQNVSVSDIVIIHHEDLPRNQWKLGRIIDLIPSKDGSVRGAVIRTTTQRGRPTTLRRPMQLLYPLEINCQNSTNQGGNQSDDDAPESGQCESVRFKVPNASGAPARRKAAVQSDERRQAWLPNLV